MLGVSKTYFKMVKIRKALLCVCSGVPPKESSILINALLVHHYKRGAYYPKGGASEISFHIIRTIQKYGGTCLVRAPVSQILVNEKGAAYGRTPARSSPVDTSQVTDCAVSQV